MATSTDKCCQKQAKRGKGMLGSTGTVTGFTPTDGGLDPSTSGTLTGVGNARRFPWNEYTAGDVCWVEWDEDAEAWELTFVELKASQYQTTYRYDTTNHKLQKKMRPLSVWFSADEDDTWTDIYAVISQSLVTDVEDSGSHLTHDKRTTYVFQVDTESSDNIVEIAAQSVVTDVEGSGSYLTHDKKTVYVMKPGSESTDNVIAIEDCP